jgi:hypothetical protein
LRAVEVVVGESGMRATGAMVVMVQLLALDLGLVVVMVHTEVAAEEGLPAVAEQGGPPETAQLEALARTSSEEMEAILAAMTR